MSRQFATLTDLPPELLLQIFTPLTTAAKPIPVCPCLECNGKRSSRRWVKTASRHWKGVNILRGTSLLSLLLIHPITYTIASELFYSQNNFTLVVHSSFVSSAIKASDKGLFGTLPSLRRIRSLTVELETMRWFVRDAVVPLLEDMAFNGHLTFLKVKLFEKAARAGWLIERGAVVAPSMFALLRAMDSVPSDGRVQLYSFRTLMDGWHGQKVWLSPTAYDVPGTFGEEQVKVVEMDWRLLLKDVREREDMGSTEDEGQ